MSAKTEKYVLAIDLGTSSCKTALVSICGEVVGWEAEPVALYLLPDGGAEQCPHDWWNAILRTSKKLLHKDLVSRADIIAVCATTQGAGTVPVDQKGDPLMNCVTWLDSRGAKHTPDYVGGVIKIEGYDPIKLFKWMRLTGGAPAMSGKDISGHIQYIKFELPDIYDRTYKFLNVLDYVNFRLTGEFVATGDSIMDSWVTDNRNCEAIRYDKNLLKISGVEPHKFPEIVRGIDLIGCLRAEIADDLGLKRDVKVVAGALDYTAAAVGSGAVEDYQAHLYIGTSSWLSAHVPFKKTDLSHYMASLPCAIPDKYLLTASQDTAGGNLTFLRDRLIFHKDEMLNQEAGEFYGVLDAVAEKVPAGSNGVIYTPWLYGERCPIDDPTIRAGIHNLSLGNTRSDVVRAFLEGVALNTRWMLAPVEKFIGSKRIDPINMIGGGANSALWCQIHADILNRTIRQVKDPVQANARGAAFIAAVGLGLIDFKDIPAYVQFNRIFDPNPDNRALYEERFDIFVEIYKRNKDIYRRLNGVKN
jgi:xylulokinase